MEENPFESVQGVARYVLERFEVPVSTDEDKDVQELLEIIRSGRCQACAGELGKNTVLIVNKTGPVAAYCCGACLQDQAILGWMQEQHKDLIDRVQFRNPEMGADEADDEG